MQAWCKVALIYIDEIVIMITLFTHLVINSRERLTILVILSTHYYSVRSILEYGHQVFLRLTCIIEAVAVTGSSVYRGGFKTRQHQLVVVILIIKLFI
jgi:hypothetical protein